MHPTPVNTNQTLSLLPSGVCVCDPADVSVPHVESPGSPLQSSRMSSRGSAEDLASVLLCPHDLAGRMRGNLLLQDYTSYMGTLLRSQGPTPSASPGPSSTQASPTEKVLHWGGYLASQACSGI